MSRDIYKNKTRLRVNGLLIEDNAVLLAQIKSPVTGQLIWMPPGGGLEFGEKIADCLQREFKEETGLNIAMGSLIAINEVVKPPFHAVELYFKLKKTSGTIKRGKDPEHEDDEQVIKDLRWVPFDELTSIAIAPDALPQWIDRLQSSEETSDIFLQTN